MVRKIFVIDSVLKNDSWKYMIKQRKNDMKLL